MQQHLALSGIARIVWQTFEVQFPSSAGTSRARSCADALARLETRSGDEVEVAEAQVRRVHQDREAFDAARSRRPGPRYETCASTGRASAAAARRSSPRTPRETARAASAARRRSRAGSKSSRDHEHGEHDALWHGPRKKSELFLAPTRVALFEHVIWRSRSAYAGFGPLCRGSHLRTPAMRRSRWCSPISRTGANVRPSLSTYTFGTS